MQRYRNALFSLLQLAPYVVSGQEKRAIISNFSEFYARAAMDWEKLTPEMKSQLKSAEGLQPHQRWAPRSRRACVFCARLLWHEDLHELYLAGPDCFMKSPERVAELLAWEAYYDLWLGTELHDIPALKDDLESSSVELRVGDTDEVRKLLLHKRRVNGDQAYGRATCFVCGDCEEAFKPANPWL